MPVLRVRTRDLSLSTRVTRICGGGRRRLIVPSGERHTSSRLQLREVDAGDDVARREERDLVAGEGVRDHLVGLRDRADVHHAHRRRLQAIQLAHLRHERGEVDRLFLRREDRRRSTVALRDAPDEDGRRDRDDRGDQQRAQRR